MRIFFKLIFTTLLFIGCNEASLKETDAASTFVAINITPPAVNPGEDINISIALDSLGVLEKADIQIGNHMFVQKNMVNMQIPSDISQLFGDQVAGKLHINGYADVPVRITSANNIAEKYFRITGNNYEPSLYDENPSIDIVSYTTSQIETTTVGDSETIIFDPDNVPDRISFSVDEVTIDENIKDNFIYSWYVSGNSTEKPEIIESDELDGSADISLKSSDGSPIIGTYRFYLVLKPAETYALSYEARYCNDFITFTINTTGETVTEDEESDISETDDTD